MVHRDIELARLTGARIHLLHLSTERSVELVRAAKADGVAVTAEAAPHHLSLTDDALDGYSPTYKVNPPLRRPSDVAAIRAGLADGTIDAIATDHAPHASETKEQPLDHAPPGMLGLETALGVALAHLDMPLTDIVAALSWKPAAIAGLDDRHGRPIARRGAGQPHRVRSRRRVGGPAGAAGEQEPQHALRRHPAARPGAPHGLQRRPGRRRRDTTTMNRYTHIRMNMHNPAVLSASDGSADADLRQTDRGWAR